MRRKFFLILTVILTVLVVASIAAGCNTVKEGEAERIEVENTHIFLAPYGDADSPYGDPSTYKIETNVYPLETADQGVHFSLKDSADRGYLSVGTDGTISAKGEVKADEEGNPLDIIVVVTSNQNPNLSIEITVTIEELEVEKIYFDTNTLVAYLYDDPVQIIPRFVPSHAVIGREVEYRSDDESIATVDSNGLVTPKSPKKVAIWVSTPRQGAFDKPVTGFITIDVRYADLNYSLDLLSEPSAMKQVYGSAEELQFTLLRLSEECDPSPNIIWYVNSTQIDDGASKNKPSLSYTPSSLPPGEYVIRAELYNSTQSLTLVSDTLIIYEPLQAISLDVFGSAPDAEYLVGDMINFIVTYTTGQYPPDQYRWKITYASPEGETATEFFNKAPAGLAANGDRMADLSYQFEEPGVYTLEVEAYVKGASSGITGRPITVEVGGRNGMCEIYGLRAGGRRIDGINYAAILWDALPYDAEIVVETEVNGNITSMSSESSEFGRHFGRGELIVPQYVVGLQNDFRYRVKAEGSGWTEWAEYSADDIPAGAYDYLEEFVPGHDRFIADISDLGDLLNYISLFRPEGDFVRDSDDGDYCVELDLYIPVVYDEDVSEEEYPFGEKLEDALENSNYNAAGRNAYKILAAAIYSYVDTVNMTFSISTDSVLGGKVGYVLTFVSDSVPDETPADSGGLDNAEIFTHYSENPRGEQGVLPIEKLTETMQVTTSGQLMYAAMHGYKPSPAAGSAAEKAYDAAKTVLNSIIDDGMNDFEKALAIYDWLTANVAYDKAIDTSDVDYSDRAFFIEGALVDKVAVCDGISKTYALMMSMEGIHTYRIMGNSNGVSHAWNAAVIDGSVYYIDPTWANKTIDWGAGEVEVIDYDSFMMTAEEISVGHTTYGKLFETPDVGLSDEVYLIETGEGTDFTVDADSEFAPLFGYVSERTEEEAIWVSVWISMEYLNDRTEEGMVPFAIEDHIRETVGKTLLEAGDELLATRIGKFGNSGWELKVRVGFGE